MLLHSPIRVVYLCIQGFDSRLACRICNNTVQSRIRADGLSLRSEEVERIRQRREGRTTGEGKVGGGVGGTRPGETAEDDSGQVSSR